MEDNAPATKRDLELTKHELRQAIEEAVRQVTDSVTELIRDTETKMLQGFTVTPQARRPDSSAPKSRRPQTPLALKTRKAAFWKLETRMGL